MDTKRDEFHADNTSLQAMIDEFRAAKQRQVVQRGMTLWNRTEAPHALQGLPTAETVALALPEEDAQTDD
jgi:hypothetical protein